MGFKYPGGLGPEPRVAPCLSLRQAFGGWVGHGVEAVDELLVAILEAGIVDVRVFAHEGDDFAVIVDGLPMVATDLADQTEAGVAVMHVGKALQQCIGGLLRLVELAGVDEIDDGVGGGGQLGVAVVAEAELIVGGGAGAAASAWV